MNIASWEHRYDDELSIAFQDTCESEYANETEFRNAMWKEFCDNKSEDMRIEMENQKWCGR